MPDLTSLEEQASNLSRLVAGLTTSMSVSNEAIAQSNERIGDSNHAIAELNTYGRQSRRLIRGVIISVAFDILLSVGLAFSLVNANEASRQAHALAVQNRANAIAACMAGNQVRANDITLWSHVLDLAKKTPQTEEFRAFVKKTFAPRDCNQG